MKVALYGNKENELVQYKEELEGKFIKAGRNAKIDCYIQQSVLREKMYEYDVVLLSKTFMEELNNCIEKGERKSVTFISGKEIETFYLDDILYIEADLKRVHIWTIHGEIILVLPISEVEKILANEGFIKTHRSYIVNCKHISSIHADTIILNNNLRVPVSKYRFKTVKEQYLDWIEDR